MKSSRAFALVLACLIGLAACAPPRPAVHAVPEADKDWPFYGANEGGQRFSAATQINPQNVAALEMAWSFSTGDLTTKAGDIKHAAFEDTPIMADGRLYICTPFNEIFALDPASGKKLWFFDPKIDPKIRYPNSNNCRGVAFWRDAKAEAGALCATRIFAATNDRRLIGLDAATGKPCAEFGEAGTIDVGAGVTLHRPGEMQITSAPVVARGTIVVGSSIDDNQEVRQVSGVVRAYDARTGARKWVWDPLATAAKDVVAGAANAWAPMSTDEARGLVYLPTGSASPDFWGGLRKGEAGDADSIVALDIETGKRVWAFKTVHHNVWDYDNPAQPTLATISWNGGAPTPAVLAPTKQGLLFTLNSATGQPLIPVEERPVPQGAAEGDELSPTQPFPTAPAPLAPNMIAAKDAYGLTPWDRADCRKKIEGARNEGLFTPPSTQGTIIYPFTGGGVNWGGLAFDPARQIAYVNTSSAMHLVTLIPADKVKAVKAAEPDVEISAQTGAPFGMRREVLLSGLGLPCNPPPWGLLQAIDMRTGKMLWRVPFGTTEDLAPGSQLILRNVGAPNFGGPMTTASGLVFIGASLDNYMRAFDAANGKELWRGRLPAGGQATPMTYVWQGRQYVVIAAGGHAKSDTKRGDQVIAFALPQ